MTWNKVSTPVPIFLLYATCSSDFDQQYRGAMYAFIIEDPNVDERLHSEMLFFFFDIGEAFYYI